MASCVCACAGIDIINHIQSASQFSKCQASAPIFKDSAHLSVKKSRLRAFILVNFVVRTIIMVSVVFDISDDEILEDSALSVGLLVNKNVQIEIYH